MNCQGGMKTYEYSLPLNTPCPHYCQHALDEEAADFAVATRGFLTPQRAATQQTPSIVARRLEPLLRHNLL
jgi:hypothetical protein